MLWVKIFSLSFCKSPPYSAWPMRTHLTERQNQALEYIRSYQQRHRKPPTLTEIGAALEIRSTNGVHKILTALESKGYLSRERHAARGLTLVEPERDPFALDVEIPNLIIISRTPSHEPEKLRVRPNGFLSIDHRFIQSAAGPDRCLVGRAEDDGMNNEGIRKGDFIVVEEIPWRELHNGEAGAFLVRDLFIVRRYTFANGRIHLIPSDRTYSEETFAPGDSACYAVGRVLALLRRY